MSIDKKESASIPSASSSLKMAKVLTPEFVKRKRFRKITWIVLGISFVGCLAMSLAAYLGQNLGHFTIQLNNNNTDSLAMGSAIETNGDETNLSGQTTFLDAGGFETASLTQADNLPALKVIDADVTSTNVADSSSKTDYFSYTFYLKNTSTAVVSYASKMYVTSCTEPTNVDSSCSLESIIRIRIFENAVISGETATHDMTTYARKKTLPKISSGEYESRELISKADAKETYNQGYATSFLTDDGLNPSNIVIFDNSETLNENSVTRYTVVMWLEGNDPDCDDVEQPVGGSLTLAWHFSTEGEGN